jgi:putative effector of murein hydrolase
LSLLFCAVPVTVARQVVASGFVGIFAAQPLLARLQVTKSRERGLAVGRQREKNGDGMNT